jgi:uncharacterized protein Yka (UPF0111/DUF47 family)
MTSVWKKVLGRDEKFFDLLEASAEEANASATQLNKFLVKIQTVLSNDHLQDLNLSRRKDKEITAEITRELCRTFVTPLDREDISTFPLGNNKIRDERKRLVSLPERKK